MDILHAHVQFQLVVTAFRQQKYPSLEKQEN